MKLCWFAKTGHTYTSFVPILYSHSLEIWLMYVIASIQWQAKDSLHEITLHSWRWHCVCIFPDPRKNFSTVRLRYLSHANRTFGKEMSFLSISYPSESVASSYQSTASWIQQATSRGLSMSVSICNSTIFPSC